MLSVLLPFLWSLLGTAVVGAGELVAVAVLAAAVVAAGVLGSAAVGVAVAPPTLRGLRGEATGDGVSVLER